MAVQIIKSEMLKKLSHPIHRFAEFGYLLKSGFPRIVAGGGDAMLIKTGESMLLKGELGEPLLSDVPLRLSTDPSWNPKDQCYYMAACFSWGSIFPHLGRVVRQPGIDTYGKQLTHWTTRVADGKVCADGLPLPGGTYEAELLAVFHAVWFYKEYVYQPDHLVLIIEVDNQSLASDLKKILEKGGSMESILKSDIPSFKETISYIRDMISTVGVSVEIDWVKRESIVDILSKTRCQREAITLDMTGIKKAIGAIRARMIVRKKSKKMKIP